MVESKWNMVPLSMVTQFNKDTLSDKTDKNYTFKYVDISSIKNFSIVDDLKTFRFEKAPSRARRVAQKGDVVISTVRTYLRAICPIKEDLEDNIVFSTGFCVITPNKNNLLFDFLSYYLISQQAIDDIVSHSNGVSYPSINSSELERLRIPLPPLEIQQRIADYLDRETAQIDDNVSNLNAYVELLKQRRQVSITDAVTGRIDSNGKRTNTDIKSSKFMIGQVFSLRSDQVDSKDFQPLSVGKRGVTLQLEKVAKSGKTDGRKLVRKGDIVINSRSDRRGSAGLSNYEGSVSLIYIVLEPKNNFIDSTFAHHLIRSKWFQEEFYKYGTGIVDDLWTTRYDRMAQIQLSIPPLDEQKRIADYLDRETAEIDALIEDSTRLRDLLLKRRQVLITEVVTGKKEV